MLRRLITSAKAMVGSTPTPATEKKKTKKFDTFEKSDILINVMMTPKHNFIKRDCQGGNG
jgi:hypothetical protein